MHLLLPTLVTILDRLDFIFMRLGFGSSLYFILFSCFVLVYSNIACLFQALFCVMQCAFHQLVFPNSMFTPFFNERAMCALER